MKKERFEAITDGILAIIITLMVLEIKIPELSFKNAPQVLQHILIYGISFIYITILWLNHHHVFANVKTVDLDLVWVNFGLLFFVSLFPLATEHISADFYAKANHIFFALVIGFITLLYTLIQQTVMKKENNSNKRKINTRNWFAFMAFMLSIPLCFISVYISGLIFLAVPAIYFLLSKKTIQ